MKVFQLVQESPYTFLKKVITNFNQSGFGHMLSFDGHNYLFDVKEKIESAFNRPLTYKTVFNHLFNALAEGLKQNFLGPNINMEFFMLTMRVYIKATIGLAVGATSIISQKFISK